jgi:hypothetical protein
MCKDKLSSTCGKKHPSKCVIYEGDLHANTELESCDCHSVEDVIEDINSEIDDINNAIDVSSISADCMTFDVDPDQGKVLINEVVVETVAKVCELATKVEAEEDCPSIFTTDFTCLGLDMGCLTDSCGEPITNLKDLLQALINKVCQ